MLTLMGLCESGFAAPVLGMPAPSPTTSVWVAKWVDYSTKYGLGYQLTGGNVGVLFNDKSSLAFLPGDQYVACEGVAAAAGTR